MFGANLANEWRSLLIQLLSGELVMSSMLICIWMLPAAIFPALKFSKGEDRIIILYCQVKNIKIFI